MSNIHINMSNYVFEEVSFDEFYSLVKWYEYSQNLKKKIESKMNNSPFKEYFLIDSQWIKNLEEVFQYADIIEGIIKKIN